MIGKGLKWAIGTIALVLAGVHVAFSALAIDGVLMGLLGIAVLFFFFDIDSIEWQGVRARQVSKRVDRAEQKLEGYKPIGVLAAAEPSVDLIEEETDVSTPVVHHEPAELTPPTDLLDRFLWASEQIRIELIVLAATSKNNPLRSATP